MTQTQFWFIIGSAAGRDPGGHMDYLSLILDAVLVLIFVSAVFEGRRRGFAVTALSFAASLISIIAAREYAEPLAEWANKAFVHDGIVNKLAGIIGANLSSGTDSVIEALPDYIVKAAEGMGVSVENLIGSLASDVSAVKVAEEITAAAEKAVILPLLCVVSFLVIFAAGKALLGIGAGVIGLAAKLPIIRTVDKSIGALAGALKGILAVVIVSVVLGTVGSLAGDNEFGKAVGDTFILQRVANLVNLIIFE